MLTQKQMQVGPLRRLLAGPLVLLLSIATALAFSAATASAAPSRFIVESCDSALPGGAVPASSFSVNPGVAFAPFQNCASPGGSIGITETGHVSATFSILSIEIPPTPGGFVESEAISAIAAGFGPGNSFSHVYENGWPANNQGDSQRVFHIRTAPSFFFGSGGGFPIVMTCDGNYAPGCEAGPVIAAHYIAATQVDPVAPKIAGVGGSLLGGGVIRGHAQSLYGEASDVGAGLAKVWASVNGAVAAELPPIGCSTATVSNPSVVGTVALSPTPCPTKVPATWSLDTEKYPFHTGDNAVSICASDFSTLSEPNVTCSPAATVNVDNTCTESSVIGGDQLSAQFKSTESDKVTVGYNGSATVRGGLTSAAGAPVAGATLCVKETVLNSFHRVKAEGAVMTDANGHYSYVMKGGPNRELLVGYRHDSAQISDELRYFAHAGPVLHASSRKVENGHKVYLTGKVPGPNAVGRVVIIQASAPGSKRWLTFHKAVSGKGGEFMAAYRFGHTTVATTYRMRAVVPHQKDYAWEEGWSRPVRIRVTPN